MIDSTTSKHRAGELITLARLLAERQPNINIMVQFVPSLDEMTAHPERKCTCGRPVRGIAFCYCLVGGKEDYDTAETAGRTQ